MTEMIEIPLFTIKDLKALHNLMVNNFVGPMPPEDFLAVFMPGKVAYPGELDLSKVAKASSPLKATRRLSRALGRLFPHFKLNWIDPREHLDIYRGYRPGGACYRKHTPCRQTVPDEWKSVEFFFNISYSGKDVWAEDPNVTVDESDEATIDPLVAERAQTIVAAKSMFSYQFRTAVYSFTLVGSTACFFRWDRAGVVVTEAFNYVERPQLLAEFMQRYEIMTPKERGWDTTAVPATDAEAQLLYDAVKAYLADVRAFKVPMLPGILELFDFHYPKYTVSLLDPDVHDDSPPPRVVVGRPTYELPVIASRATLGHVAYHLDEQKLVFMKDIWADAGSFNEVDAYQTLAKAELLHLPNTLYSANLRHLTLSQLSRYERYAWGAKRPCQLQEREHLRILQDIVYPLRFVHNSKHLVQSVRDIFTCMHEVSDKARMLHHDISMGNIMLTSNGEAVLNDWDLARPIGVEHDEPMGTLRLYSIDAANALMTDTPRNHVLDDDAESGFWVLLDMACDLGLTVDEDTLNMIQGMLDDYTGQRKRRYIMDESSLPPHFKSTLFDELVNAIRSTFRAQRRNPSEAGDLTSSLVNLFDEFLSRADWPEYDTLHYAAPPRSGAFAPLWYTGVSGEDVQCMMEPEYSHIIPVPKERTEPVADPVAPVATSGTPTTPTCSEATLDEEPEICLSDGVEPAEYLVNEDPPTAEKSEPAVTSRTTPELAAVESESPHVLSPSPASSATRVGSEPPIRNTEKGKRRRSEDDSAESDDSSCVEPVEKKRRIEVFEEPTSTSPSPL